MKWFGESWGAAVCRPENRVPRPAGACARCGLAFDDESSGFIMPAVEADGSAGVASYHQGCLLESFGVRAPTKRAREYSYPYTKEDLIHVTREMRATAGKVYDLFFWSGMGSKVHAYIEFCGLLSKYVDICQRAAERGIDFTVSSVHTGIPLPVEVHDMHYLGEKLACIFGPMIAANPKAREALKKELFPDE